jgi:hypothetical protein
VGEVNFSRRKKARYGITGALRLQMKATKDKYKKRHLLVSFSNLQSEVNQASD